MQVSVNGIQGKISIIEAIGSKVKWRFQHIKSQSCQRKARSAAIAGGSARLGKASSALGIPTFEDSAP